MNENLSANTSPSIPKNQAINPTIYCLFEECEKRNGQYKHRLLTASSDKSLLRELLKAKVAADEYGLIALKGVEGYDEDNFQTHTDFSFGFVKYYIVDVTIQTKETLLKLIASEAKKAKLTFEETIWDYPKSKPVLNFMRGCRDGDITQVSIIAFIEECRKQVDLTQQDIQYIKNNYDCKAELFKAVYTFIEKEDAEKDVDNVRSFYTNERKDLLITVLAKAYREYRTKNPGE